MSRKITLILLPLALLVVLLAIFVLRVPSELLVRLEPVSVPAPDFGSQLVVVAPDERIFTLFAALNAAGYDREYEGIPMTSVRQKVREALALKDLPSLKRLRPIFDRVSEYHLVVWILQRGNGPEFGRVEPDWWVTTRAADFDGLPEALNDFYIEADIPELWRMVEPEFCLEIERWKPMAEASMNNIWEYLGVSQFPFRQLVIIPNLLTSYYDGYGPQIGNTAYVIAGPTETERSLSGLIEHEALHSIIGPMLDRNKNVVSDDQAKRLFAVLKKTMPSGYGSWEGALEETLIRVINLRMVKEEQLRARMLSQLEDQGFLLIYPMNEALSDYEQSGYTFERYLPKLLGTLNTVQITPK